MMIWKQVKTDSRQRLWSYTLRRFINQFVIVIIKFKLYYAIHFRLYF